MCHVSDVGREVKLMYGNLEENAFKTAEIDRDARVSKVCRVLDGNATAGVPVCADYWGHLWGLQSFVISSGSSAWVQL